MSEADSIQFHSSAEMEKLFLKHFAPALEAKGFDYVGKCRWVRETGKGFKHLFYLYPWRPGMDFIPHGGISLDFVPRLETGIIRMRREPKYARVHVSIGREFSESHSNGWWISRQKDKAESNCVAVAEKSIPAIELVLKPLNSLQSVLDLLLQKKNADGESFYCFPETSLAYAFTLAKLGKTEDAVKELERVINSYDEETHTPIKQIFARISEF
jgi:hypothetical protein